MLTRKEWDYGSPWSNPGCPKGNCLRSHVNLTETINSLSMVTKAGVPSNKLVIGVSSYGRSFGMTDPNCDGPLCSFIGPDSAATKGECTDTAGYVSNAEINRLIANKKRNGVKSYFDTNSQSDILVYGSDWVAYMSDKTKATRTSIYKGLNFAGTTDWAVDLAEFYAPVEDEKDPEDEPDDGDWRNIKCTHPYADDEEPENALKRWNALKGHDVWKAGIEAWKAKRDSTGMNFVSFSSDYWGGPPGFNCEKIAHGSGCAKTIDCEENDPDMAPAGALILRSIQNLYDVSLPPFNEHFASSAG